jgi:DNA-binding response OmpR family regulator
MSDLKKGPILIIEDDKSIRDLLAEFLEMEDYEVFTAANGAEGLESLKNIRHPCMILLDFFMPVMDGAGFLKGLKAEHADKIAALPIVLISAAPTDVVSGVKQHLAGYMKKPVDLDAVLELVQKHCCS